MLLIQGPCWSHLKQTFLALLLLAITTLPIHAFTFDAQKLARGGYSSSGLIPFPRTGRSVGNSDPEATAELVRNYYAQKQNDGAAGEQNTKPVDPKQTGSPQKNMDRPGSKLAEKLRLKRQSLDKITDEDEDENVNFNEKIYRLARSQNFFNQPRVDRSSWQVPYPRMGKKSVGSMIPMARLGRSNLISTARSERASMIPMARLGRSSMIPMARLGRSSMIPMARIGRASQGLVIPMARIGRSSNPSMIPMARFGRSVGEDREEMVPLYLPTERFNADWKLQHIIPDSERLEELMDILDEYLRTLNDQRLETEINEISSTRDGNVMDVKKLD